MVLTTFPDAATAERALDALIERRLAACAQTFPIQSTYRWKGEVRRDPEILALVKTRAALYPELEAVLRSLHPYETPEIVLVPISAGWPAYLRWIDEETG